MPDELPSVNPTVEREDLAQLGLGPLEHEAVLLRPGFEEPADVLAVGSVQDHADDLARGGAEGRMSAHYAVHLALSFLKIHGEKGCHSVNREGP